MKYIIFLRINDYINVILVRLNISCIEYEWNARFSSKREFQRKGNFWKLTDFHEIVQKRNLAFMLKLISIKSLKVLLVKYNTTN